MTDEKQTICPWCQQPAHEMLRNTTRQGGHVWHTLCHEQNKQEAERRAAGADPHDGSPLAILHNVCRTIVEAQRKHNVVVIVALLASEKAFNVRVVSKEMTGGKQHGIERVVTFREVELAHFDALSSAIEAMAKEVGN